MDSPSPYVQTRTRAQRARRRSGAPATPPKTRRRSSSRRNHPIPPMKDQGNPSTSQDDDSSVPFSPIARTDPEQRSKSTGENTRWLATTLMRAGVSKSASHSASQRLSHFGWSDRDHDHARAWDSSLGRPTNTWVSERPTLDWRSAAPAHSKGMRKADDHRSRRGSRDVCFGMAGAVRGGRSPTCHQGQS